MRWWDRFAHRRLREHLGGQPDEEPNQEVIDDQLHVRINPLSAPRRTRALAALCDDLTATQTNYPGTDYTLAYSVKPA